jgi:PhnB protein
LLAKEDNMAVKPIPDGYHTITPYICASDARKLIAFLQEAFDAELGHQSVDDEGRIRHAEVRVGTSMLMLAQSVPEYPATPISIYMYVPDVDATFKRALAAGAIEIQPVASQFYGDRSGGMKDPVGNTWWMATHVEDVPPAELERRQKAAMASKK